MKKDNNNFEKLIEKACKIYKKEKINIKKYKKINKNKSKK